MAEVASEASRLRLVECVPNFSEGRREEVIESIADAIRKTPGVTLLDVESNPDHNRSVISFVGEPGSVKDAALAASQIAIELIDLRHHKGEHPRMGAVDVVPFVPLSGVTMEDCISLARGFGQEFAEKFHVPVFLYEEAATTPENRNLADVREGSRVRAERARNSSGVDEPDELSQEPIIQSIRAGQTLCRSLRGPSCWERGRGSSAYGFPCRLSGVLSPT